MGVGGIVEEAIFSFVMISYQLLIYQPLKNVQRTFIFYIFIFQILIEYKTKNVYLSNLQ